MNCPKAVALLSFAAFSCLVAVRPAPAADAPSFTRTEDVIYARKWGTALNLDVFTPKANANGAAIVAVISGGWFSAHEAINPAFCTEYLGRGYTVFAVVHGSQPKYTIPEVLEDMHRSIRFIRHNAARYHVDPNRIGITGGSAGGHLSLMIGMAGKPGEPREPGDPEPKDPVDRESSRVQAVGCFFPPTDFLNYGKPGRTVLQALQEELGQFKAPFDFTELDKESRRFVLITDEKKRLEICREISPITHVSPDDPPTLIIHGDADKLVPIQQAQTMIDKLKAAGVTAELITHPGRGHGWAGMDKDVKTIADWFDRHLAKPATTTKPQQ